MIPKRKIASQPENLRNATPEQFWSLVQRCLSFESPDGRWNKIVSLLLKQLKNDKLKHKEFCDAPLTEQEQFFQQCFGPRDPAAARQSRMFNLFLALHDLETYEPEAFDMWYLSLPPEYSTGHDLKDDDADFLPELAALLKLTPAQNAWLDHYWIACPDWSRLSTNGPWHNDKLAAFIGRAVRNCAEMPGPSSAADVLKCYEQLKTILAKARPSLPTSFLPETVILVEGPTEAILLPHFAELLKFSFAVNGIFVTACGGANQLERKYLILRDICKIPIMLVLDNDAEEKIAGIREILREHDHLFVWKTGEIEDTFDQPLLLDMLNAYLQTLSTNSFVTKDDFKESERRTASLDRLWRTRGLGNFDKVGFAEFLKTHLRSPANISPEIRTLVDTLKALRSQAKNVHHSGS